MKPSQPERPIQYETVGLRTLLDTRIDSLGSALRDEAVAAEYRTAVNIARMRKSVRSLLFAVTFLAVGNFGLLVVVMSR